MFNMDKNSDVNGVKQSANNIVDGVVDNANDIVDDLKNAATDVQAKAKKSIQESKADAVALINNLKALLRDVDYSGKAHEIKAQVLGKADEWKNFVSDEAIRAIDVSTTRTKRAVQDQPLLTLGVALGAGLLIGYLLGHKESTKNNPTMY